MRGITGAAILVSAIPGLVNVADAKCTDELSARLLFAIVTRDAATIRLIANNPDGS
jgi:hypothetical protein